ncbi:MAG: hypothetical protein IMZ52_10070 [Actinobacteria bacterium]|nr:hypothetical protein [Actinomycetota bacterium]MBE3122588.1 hypothetical protein [Thermoplasmata archaeon]
MKRKNKEPAERLQDVSKKDELEWRLTVQQQIRNCLDTINSFDLEPHVIALKTSMYFNQIGLPFKKEIDEEEARLNKEREETIEDEKKNKGRQFYGRSNHARFFIKLHKTYWKLFLDSLIRILAKHGALATAREMMDEYNEKDDKNY